MLLLNCYPEAKAACFFKHMMAQCRALFKKLAIKEGELFFEGLIPHPRSSLIIMKLGASSACATLMIDLDPRRIAYKLYAHTFESEQQLLSQIEMDFPSQSAWPFKRSSPAKNSLKKIIAPTKDRIDCFYLSDKKEGDLATWTLVMAKKSKALQITIDTRQQSPTSNLLYYQSSLEGLFSTQVLFCSHKTSPLEPIENSDDLPFYPKDLTVDPKAFTRPEKSIMSDEQFLENHIQAIALLQSYRDKKVLKEKRRLELAIENIEKEKPLEIQAFAQRLMSCPSLKKELEEAILQARKSKGPIVIQDGSQQILLAPKVTSLDPSYYIQALFARVKRQKKRMQQLQEELEAYTRVVEIPNKQQLDPCKIPQELVEEIDTSPKQNTSLFEEVQPLQKIKKSHTKKKPYRHFISSSGVDILVGKSAQDNMLVSFHYAHPEDIWLHVHPYPGSHVLVRSSDLQDNQTLQEAMQLAKHFSSKAKHLKEAEITITQGKHLRKIPGAPAGKVRVVSSQHKRVYHDPKALEAIFKREQKES